MDKLQIFNYKDNNVRTINKKGEPWFVGKDVCRYFGDTNHKRSLARLDEDEKGVSQIDTPGGIQAMTIINESGLYSLLFLMKPQKANLPKHKYEKRITQIKNFKRWVTHEVIPSVRKYGAYMTPDTIDNIISNPDFGIKLLSQLKKEREEKQRLNKEVKKLKPAAEFGNTVGNCKDGILVRDFSKVLANAGIKIGQDDLFRWLNKNKYIYRDKSSSEWRPQLRYVKQGLFKVRETVISTNTRGDIIKCTMRITGKGQKYFYEKLKEMRRAG